jgi:uroporphyrinogen-III synthase
MRVVVTRTAEGAEPLVAALAAAGLEAVACPLVRIVPLDSPLPSLADYDWVVLTSPRAVAELLARAAGPLPRTAVVGPGTAAALREAGTEPALVARRSTQEGLVEELRPLLAEGTRVLFAGAADARPVLARELGADVVALYRTEPVRPRSFPDCDLVVLASASAARSFAELGVDRPCVSIGPVTSAEARRLGLEVVAEAETHDLEGLVRAVRLAASRLGRSRS